VSNSVASSESDCTREAVCVTTSPARKERTHVSTDRSIDSGGSDPELEATNAKPRLLVQVEVPGVGSRPIEQ